uniref:Helicase-primase subunit n=1 Tax=Mastomys natalensis cytomegalovirus 2 TaxID=2973540 RepID=A0A9Y1ILU5_9BETA|nr:helicase-primase subunit [Mastomys natalensis cytomegalovirus 2]WEG69236.1 helicase-primase subunit [Mastomys natalensis cytomegalovirus 2]WEG69375.1 helicase-primase subunit [Mastomys natalensis cytomegalovirus 2]WEG69513.1 helicase-primase subunit [Mastomys natalensis cytomegalovirus 2]WEG69651.1 helicase-primase subunit [Mastomys natalensis cytomegalovirus 2]
MAERRWLPGAVGHLSVYAITPETNEAILQCLFFEAMDNDRVRSQVFVYRVPIPDKGPDRIYLLKRYGPAVISSSDIPTADEGGADNGANSEDRGVSISRRSEVLGSLLLENGGPAFAMLAYLFTPVEIFTDGVEVFAARCWKDATNGFLQAVATFPVGRLRAIGSYCDERVAVRPDHVNSAANQTHAHKKICRGFAAKSLVFSIRVGGRKFVFEDTPSGRSAVVDDLFEIRDIEWRGRKLRLCSPINFLAIAFHDDQCLLLLRDSIQKLFRELYLGFPGLFPLFDFLGPNMLISGGPRSVFFPGFPCIPIYSVPWKYDLLMENGSDAINHVRSLLGLPDIVGVSGKIPVMVSRGNVLETMSARGNNVDSYFTEPRQFRINARLFEVYDLTGCGVTDTDISTGHLYVGSCGLQRIVVPEMKWMLLRMCLPGREFPFVLTEMARRLDLGAINDYICRLRYKSPRLFRRIRALETLMSKKITDACDRAGFPWLLVRNDCEFFAQRKPGNDVANLDKSVRYIIRKTWSDLFGPNCTPPAHRITMDMGGVLIVAGDVLISGFPDDLNEKKDPGWIMAAGRLLCESVYCAFDAGDWTAKDRIVRIMATHMLRLSARRHETQFWVQRFAPGRNRVNEHQGILDATEFSGVIVGGGVVAIQPMDGAVHDDIGYIDYAKRTFRLLKLCLQSVIKRLDAETSGNRHGTRFNKTEDSAELESVLSEFNEVFDESEKFVIDRYSVFFSIN